ncbi:uncharacterized protein STEHIDRAFT_154481 [Stereum hirsutum FP-91666 SS1]|uniref:uncharacterized protein n=1 Tax=Stereum hirsutum (strain FP-91666) TaxID=721885 RepID=UPI000440DBF3|nr:uncharacterized protein STEHIDRAFT_154481 [Stereum hirsutum FP-91666 SS1]EIM88760.1 hypothetical protein STEHIDRAFT_154481 [Stereum hirsutum FP-91666 SS1]
MSSDEARMQWTRLIGNWTAVSAGALWAYDYIATLPQEVRHVWTNSMSVTTVVFLVNRYSFFAALALGLATTAARDISDDLQRVDLPVGGVADRILVLRVWSISGRQTKVLIICVPLLITIVGISIYRNFVLARGIGTSHTKSTFAILAGCGVEILDGRRFNRNSILINTHQHLLAQTDEIIAVALALLLDGYVFGLTAATTWGHVLESKRLGYRGVTYIFLRDGTIHFLLIIATQLLLFTLVIISLFDGSSSYASNLWLSGLNPYLNMFPSLVVNHLVLNLRSYTPSSSSSHARPHRTRPRGRRSINGVRSILGSHSLSDIRFRSGSGEGEGAGGGFGGRGKTLSLSLSLGNIGAPLDFFGRGEGEDADADVDMGVEADSDSRFIEVEGGGEGDGGGDGGVVVIEDENESNEGIAMVTFGEA